MIKKEITLCGLPQKTRCLQRLTNEPLTIGPTEGSKVIADAGDTFKGHVDSDFRNWSADEPGPTTDEAGTVVYAMTTDATFAKMFGSLAEDVSRLCLTQAQIIEFVKTHRNWLETNGYATFFLFKSNDHFFVARVRVDVDSDGDLYVSVVRFGHSYVWDAGGRCRLVVPQL